MDTRGRAGQLLVVGVPLGEPVEVAAELVGRIAPGGVFLAGRSRAGVAAIAERTAALQRAVGPGTRTGLIVAVDQEGGQVQALTGPGFSTIPQATDQGRGSATALTEAATRWGGELRAAGINLDLAPVADVLSPELGRRNLSVGVNGRAFGTTAEGVGDHVLAFVAGMRAAGVATSVKHFPGLGQVAGNTDFSRGVRDTVTTADSASLRPFLAAVDARVPVVMVSSVVYTRIDRTRPAAFSPVVVDGLLRDRLGFTGVAISDDLGGAAAVADVALGDRATGFVAAGGDLVLTVDPATAQPMLDALVTRIGADARFADSVTTSVRRVLALKQSLGLLRC